MSSTLLADVGGTNVRFALVDPAAPETLDRSTVRRYRVAAFPAFSDAARQYLVDIGIDASDIEVADRGHAATAGGDVVALQRPTRALLAVAGPILGDQVRLTNHPWTLSMTALQRELAFEHVHAINDFAAMAYSVVLLGEGHAEVIGDLPVPVVGAGRDQTFVVMGPGTGLGVAALLVRDGNVLALSTEGGHVSFAPGNDDEIDVLRRLAARFGRVSNERLLCGQGLVNLHRALCERDGVAIDAVTPEEITAAAADDSCPRSRETVERFCELLGSAAGDLVLAYGAWDGVWLAGGIAPLLLPWLRKGGFRRRFGNKGRHGPAVACVPTQVIAHPDPGLLGAAVCAAIDSGTDVTRRHR